MEFVALYLLLHGNLLALLRRRLYGRVLSFLLASRELTSFKIEIQ